jgi:23S rRNA (adenine2503-C2)-methyltransferase
MRHSEYSHDVPTHIVFMGMGEPLLNLNNVLKTIYLMHDEMGIPQRHITVSTVGILNGIQRLAEEKLQVTLAISLHAPTDDLRHRLIPTSTKTHVEDIVEAARDYVERTGRRVTFEYVVLGGVNDSAPLAHKLAKLCKGWPCHVNLIPWNAVPDAALEEVAFTAPQPAVLQEFRDILVRNRVAVTQRVQRGADVAAACGQLRALKEDTSTRKADIALVSK